MKRFFSHKNFLRFFFSICFLWNGSDFLYGQTNTWTGSTDTDWHKDCNWSLGVQPTCSHDVVIPNTTTNKPVISGVASCKTLTVQGTTTQLLTINTGANLQVNTCPVANTSNSCCTPKYVFVSSSTYNSITSVASRDAACASDATSAGLAGTYKAWINNGGSNNITSAASGTCGFKKVDGTVVASSWAVLTGGTLASGIDKQANGTTVSGFDVWTGLGSGGTSTGVYCSNWSTWNANGTYGTTGATSGSWTNTGSDNCGSQSNTYDCSTDGWVGVHPADDCPTCYPGLANTGSVNSNFGGGNCKSWSSGSACGAWFSTEQRCCVSTGTSTTYTSKRHYCFQQ